MVRDRRGGYSSDEHGGNATTACPPGDAGSSMSVRQGGVETVAWRHSRRGVLGAVATTVAALAGCSGSTPPDESYEFRADPVGLRSGSGDELVLSEPVRTELIDEHSRTVHDDRVYVRLRNQGVACERLREESTLLEGYVDAATTSGAGGAVVVPASRLGLGADALAAGVWDGWDLPVERIGLLVPAEARADGKVELDETMALASGDAAGVAEVEVGADAAVGLFVDPAAFLPDEFYVPGEFYVPDAFYLPDGFTTPDGFDSGGVLYLDVEQRVTSLFDRLELPGETVASGGTVDLANVMLAAPGDAVFDHPGGFDPEAVFDLGDAAPLAGREFGLAGLSTPQATVDGVSVTPIVDADLRELLGHDHPRKLINEAGVTAAADVEWLRGPVPVEPAWHASPESTLLGEPIDVASFGGVLTGANGPRAAIVYAASVFDDDRVLGFGIASRPVGTPEGRDALVGEDGFIGRERFVRAAEMAASAIAELVHGE